MSRPFIRCLAVFCLAVLPLLTGCPKTVPVELPPAAQPEYWQRYMEQAAQADAQARPCSIRLTLQYDTPSGQGHRVNAMLWANPDLPVRMDLSAGVGVMVAQMREDKREFLLYILDEKTAYVHRGSNKPLLNIGTPLPFTLEKLIEMMNGRFGNVFGLSADISPDGRAFALVPSAPVQGSIRLDESGRVLHWNGSPPSGKPDGIGYGWTMDISYSAEESALALPARLSLRHEQGYSATLQIHKRTFKDELYDQSSLALELPPQTEFRQIGQNGE